MTEARLLLDKLEQNPDPEDAAELALLRSEYLLANDKPAEAREKLTHLTVPEALRCRLLLARALADLESRGPTSGDQSLAAAETSCEQSSLYWSLRGRSELAKGAALLAVQAYEEALRLAPENDDVASDLAVAQLAADDAQGAELRLAQILRRRGQDMSVRLNLDYARAMLGKSPAREGTEDLETWSRRLEAAAQGAKRSGRLAMAQALYSQALLARPKHDSRLWDEYSGVLEDK